MTTLLAVYDGSGVLKQRFEYAAGRLPVRMVESGAAYHLVYDQVGTLRAVVDSSGNVVKTVEYDTFGNMVDDSAPGFEIPFGFAGGLFDIDTGLVRFGFRDYDADVGRWTAKDPIRFNGGDSDLYGYCVNDPVGLVDVDGLQGQPGHHYVPQEIIREENFSAEVKKILYDATTGPIPKGIKDKFHRGYPTEHRVYNVACREIYEAFRGELGKNACEFTTEDAYELVRRIRSSKMSRIRDFLDPLENALTEFHGNMDWLAKEYGITAAGIDTLSVKTRTEPEEMYDLMKSLKDPWRTDLD